MKFISGFFDNCVLQRNKSNKSEQPFTGECSSSGIVIGTVLKAKKVLKGFKDLKLGTASKGKFKGILKGLPVGGPYDIVFSIAAKDAKISDSVTVKNILVGDLWLLAGQSNMQGCGWLLHKLPPVNEVRAYYMNNKWAPAKDPIHNLGQAAAPVHGGNPDSNPGEPFTGTGPGVAFGQEMLKNLKVPQGLIACAHGGTSMTQWDPELKKNGDNSFYGASINRLNRLGGKISGIIWYQGCAETGTAEDVNAYTERMVKLVKAFRKDAGNPSLPFVMVQLGRFFGFDDEESWNSIREQQYKMPSKIKNLLTVPAIDLDLDDCIHVAGREQHLLGARLADAMMSFYDKKHIKPIEFESIKVVDYPSRHYCTIELKFKNVAGCLKTGDRPSGFELRHCSDIPFPITEEDGWLNPYKDMNVKPENAAKTMPFKIELKDDTVIIYPYIKWEIWGEYEVVYGYGLVPYCNIRDSKGRSLPAFKTKIPMCHGLLTKFLPSAEISETPVYAKETDKNMSYRDNLKFVKTVQSPTMALKHPKRADFATAEEKIFYYRFFVDFPEDAAVVFQLGFDAPIKIFADASPIFKTMEYSVPIAKDKAFIEHHFTKGVHEIMIAEASNKGASHGISFRMRLLKYPAGKKLPSFVESGKSK